MPNKVINLNPALVTSYKLLIPGLESFNYFSTSAEIPGITSGGIPQPYRDRPMQLPSDRIDYDPLNVDFIVSEDFENHAQLRRWMWEFHRGSDPMWTTTKNIQLFVTTSNRVPNLRVEFANAFPTSVSSIRFDTAVADDDPIKCTATFAYQDYDVFPVN
jgi:hypothetical protein